MFVPPLFFLIPLHKPIAQSQHLSICPSIPLSVSPCVSLSLSLSLSLALSLSLSPYNLVAQIFTALSGVWGQRSCHGVFRWVGEGLWCLGGGMGNKSWYLAGSHRQAIQSYSFIFFLYIFL